MTENFRRLYFIMLFALVFYVVGAGFIQSFVNYPTWKLIGADEFIRYHNGMSPLIIKFMVLPWLVEILLTVGLLWLRPHIIPRWAVGLALIFHLIAFISTIMIQIPIQMQLGESGLSPDLIDRLLVTDWIRLVPGILRALLYLWMMSLVVRRAVQRMNKGLMLPNSEFVRELV